MSGDERIRSWIEAGKQVGTSFAFDLAGSPCWTSVAVQKWNGRYRVYVDEILETQMSAEEYEREDVVDFDTLDDAVRYIDAETKARFADLRPCKGQKIFNPQFDE